MGLHTEMEEYFSIKLMFGNHELHTPGNQKEKKIITRKETPHSVRELKAKAQRCTRIHQICLIV